MPKGDPITLAEVSAVLGVKKTRDGIFCELSEFLGTLVNCGDSSPMMVPRTSLKPL